MAHIEPQTMFPVHQTLLTSHPTSRQSHQASPPIHQPTRQTAPPDYKPCMLPPCCICGQRSSGFHYGANTCEACKGFFRRCMMRKKVDFHCDNKGQCIIQASNRQSCKRCRYQKCLSNGMSRHASRNGRYSAEVATENIIKVKRLELLSKIDRNGGLLTNSQHEQEMASVIEKLTEVSLDMPSNTADTMENIQQKEQQFNESRELDRALYGERRFIPHSEYAYIYEMTGLDVDGRREMMTKLTPSIQRRINTFVEFSKTLPGFKEICTEDQLTILRGSVPDRWLFTYGPWVNIDTLLIPAVDESDPIVSLHDLLGLDEHTTELSEQLQTYFVRLQRLELTTEETLVCAGICLMNRLENISTESVRISSACVEYLTEALVFLITQNHDEEEMVLPKAIQLMTDMRNLEDLHARIRCNTLLYCDPHAIPDVCVDFLTADKVARLMKEGHDECNHHNLAI